MDDKFDNLIVNLKILAKIPRNGRIRRFKGKVTLEDDHLFVPIKRFIYNDSRDQALTDITSIIYDSFSEIKYLHSHITFTVDGSRCSNMKKLDMILTDLKDCIIGLENLKNTYKEDPQVTAHIDLMITKIQSYLDNDNRNNLVTEPIFNSEHTFDSPV